jgi:hypothetical protein
LALAETLRVNPTLASLVHGLNCLGEGGGRALAEALRLNIMPPRPDWWQKGIKKKGFSELLPS